jgi:hypothetical protein
MMKAKLKSQLMRKIERLPEERVIEVLHFVEFILVKSSGPKAKVSEATDAEVLNAIEASGALDFYYNDSQDVYTLKDGKPI